MRKYFLIFSLLFLCSESFSQIQTQQLDSLFNVLDKRELALGSLTISKDGKILYQKSVGFSYIFPKWKTRATSQTRYRIGSVSKMFTAVMIFQLMEEGKIKPNQKLSAFFPDLPNANEITINQLLNHQSGLHDYTKDTGFETWMDKPKSQTELLQIVRDKGADFEPGARNEYCNTNYLLLSYILENVTQLTYEANLRKRIVSKIGLKDTYMAKASETTANESISYKYTNASWSPVKQTDSGIHSGAGALVSTPSDLTLFIQALFTGKLVRQSSLDKMKTMTNDYGLGLFPYDHGSVKGYGHNGRIEEFYTAVRYFPESKISVAYCTNGINFPRTDLLESVIRSCFNEPVSIPFTVTEVVNPEQFSGTYTAEQMPVVTISTQEKKVIAETQGTRFELEPVSENYFMHGSTGYYFEFIPAQNELRIKETDNVYFLKKK
jgi:D-alanyl-D-alanine carboxypeptidase